MSDPADTLADRIRALLVAGGIDPDTITVTSHEMVVVSPNNVMVSERIEYVPGRVIPRSHLPVHPRQDRIDAGKCMAGMDGECFWDGCPQENPETRQTRCPRHHDEEED